MSNQHTKNVSQPFIKASLIDSLRKADQKAIVEGAPTAQQIIDENSPDLTQLQTELKQIEKEVAASKKQHPSP